MNQKTIIHFRKLSENKIESFPRSPPTDVIKLNIPVVQFVVILDMMNFF